MNKALQGIRKQIDRTDKQIINLLSFRSNYKQNLHLYMPCTSDVLHEKGFFHEVPISYVKILKLISQKGKNRGNINDLLNLDAKLYKKLNKRIFFGEPIAQFKYNRDLPIQNLKREKELIQDRIKYSKTINFDVDIKKIFSIIMGRTKDVQDCVMKSTRTKANPPIETYLTACKKCIPVLKTQAQNRIKELNGNREYIIKVEKTPNGYEIQIRAD